MELQVLDPWGDYETRGYLRNHHNEKDLRLVGRLETAAFEQEVVQVVRFLRRLPSLSYENVTETHQRLFHSVYPWAGQDRSATAPNIAIVKAGYKTLFAHPADVKRAADHALRLGQDTAYLQTHLYCYRALDSSCKAPRRPAQGFCLGGVFSTPSSPWRRCSAIDRCAAWRIQ
jgi:cell filamentation protein